MEEEHNISQDCGENNGINNNNNNNNNQNEIKYVDYMQNFGEEKLLTENEIEEDIFTFEEYYTPVPEKAYKLTRFYLPIVAKFVGTDDLIRLAKVDKKTSNISYLIHQNFDNVEHQQTIFHMNTHVIYTAVPDAPCQFIKDAIHEIKGNPLSNKRYLNCRIYMLCEKRNPKNKLLFGYSKQIPKDIFNCAVYFIKLKGLKSSIEVNSWYSCFDPDLMYFVDDPNEDIDDEDIVVMPDYNHMRMRKFSIPYYYNKLATGIKNVVMSGDEFYKYFETGKYEIQCFDTYKVIIKMMDLDPCDPFRVEFIKEFNDRTSVNGVIIRNPLHIDYGIKDFNYFNGLSFHEAGSTQYNKLFGFQSKLLEVEEKSNIPNPFFNNDDLNEVYVINCYLAFGTSRVSFNKDSTNGKVRSSVIILVNKNLYSTILIKNKLDFHPLYFNRYHGGGYNAISQLNDSDIYLICNNCDSIDRLIKTRGASRNFFRVFGITKYTMDDNLIIQNVPHPIDLFYYTYRAKRIGISWENPQELNHYACEDALIELNHDVGIPIQEFT